jgi:hypothetical protein
MGTLDSTVVESLSAGITDHNIKTEKKRELQMSGMICNKKYMEKYMFDRIIPQEC